MKTLANKANCFASAHKAEAFCACSYAALAIILGAVFAASIFVLLSGIIIAIICRLVIRGLVITADARESQPAA